MDNNRCNICVVNKTKYFKEYSQALTRCLNEANYKTQLIEEIEYSHKPEIFIIVGAHLFKDKFKNYNETIYIGIQTEQLPTNQAGAKLYSSGQYNEFLKLYKNYDILFDWSPVNYNSFKNQYPNIYFSPHSYFREMEYFDTNASISGDEYDVLFVGKPTGINNRREKILEKIDKKFKLYPKSYGLWGDEKRNAILSSKICLNIHFEFSYVFESPRIYEYIVNKRFVLSESIINSFPFEKGRHYETFNGFNLIDKINHFLDDEKSRIKIQNEAYQMASNFPLKNSVNDMINVFELERFNKKNRKYRFNNKLFHYTGFSYFKDLTKVYPLEHKLVKFLNKFMKM